MDVPNTFLSCWLWSRDLYSWYRWRVRTQWILILRFRRPRLPVAGAVKNTWRHLADVLWSPISVPKRNKFLIPAHVLFFITLNQTKHHLFHFYASLMGENRNWLRVRRRIQFTTFLHPLSRRLIYFLVGLFLFFIIAWALLISGNSDGPRALIDFPMNPPQSPFQLNVAFFLTASLVVHILLNTMTDFHHFLARFFVFPSISGDCIIRVFVLTFSTLRSRKHWVLPGFTEFYWVLLSFTRF